MKLLNINNIIPAISVDLIRKIIIIVLIINFNTVDININGNRSGLDNAILTYIGLVIAYELLTLILEIFSYYRFYTITNVIRWFELTNQSTLFFLVIYIILFVFFKLDFILILPLIIVDYITLLIINLICNLKFNKNK